jgi:WD40 repeat protein
MVFGLNKPEPLPAAETLAKEDAPMCLAVADKAGFAITGDGKGVVRGMEVLTGKPVFKVDFPKSAVLGIDISVDGHKAVMFTADGALYFLELTNDKSDPTPPVAKGQLTLAPIASQTVKAGANSKLPISVVRKDCQGDVAVAVVAPPNLLKVTAVTTLSGNINQHEIPYTVDANAPSGTYKVQVVVMLDKLMDTKLFELTVEKPGEPAKPPVDPANPPLKITETTIYIDGKAYSVHTGAVNSVGLSGDKKWAVSGGADGTVHLWELDTGKVATIHKDAPIVSAVAISPDGKWAASGDVKGGIRLYNLEKKTSQEIQPPAKALPGQPQKENRIHALEFAAKNDLLIAATQLGCSSWKIPTGQHVLNINVADSPCLHFSEDGKHAYAIARKSMAIFDARGAAPLSYLGGGVDKGTEYGATYFDCYPSKQEIIAIVPRDKQGELQRINAKTGQGQQLVAFTEMGEMPLRVVVADKAGYALTSDKQGLLRAWDLDSGKEVYKLEGHKGEVLGLAVSADGRRFVSGGADGTVRIVDVSNNKADPNKTDKPPKPPEPAKLDSWEQRLTWHAHQRNVRALAYSPDGKYLVTGGEDAHVTVWDAETGKSAHELGAKATKGAPVVGVYFSGDGKTLLVAVEGFDKTLPGFGLLYDTTTWNVKQTLSNGSRDLVHAMAISKAGNRVLSVGAGNQVVVWDAVKGEPTKTFTHKSLTSTANCALDADNMLVMCKDKDGRYNLLDIEKKEVVYTGVLHKDSEGATFFPDSKRAATWGDNGTQLRTVELPSGKGSAVFQGAGQVGKAVVSRDGKLIATAPKSAATLTIWEVDTQKELFAVQIDKKKALHTTTYCFSPDNSRIAIGSDDGDILIYARAAMK